VAHCIPAPACRAALAEATRRWPNRNRATDGICGDAAHHARVSDHNTGDAFDLTHDPIRGCDAHRLAEALVARRDPRVKYVISRRRIWNPSVSPRWRPYTGSNPHESHAHVSIRQAARGDTSPWWAGTVPTAPPTLEVPRMILYWQLGAIHVTDGFVRGAHGLAPAVADGLIAGGARVVGVAGRPHALHTLPVGEPGRR
jgi:hypothetical protein